MVAERMMAGILRDVCGLLVGDVNELMRLFVSGWYVLEDGGKEEGAGVRRWIV